MCISWLLLSLQETYEYYDLPFCKPEQGEPSALVRSVF